MRWWNRFTKKYGLSDAKPTMYRPKSQFLASQSFSKFSRISISLFFFFIIIEIFFFSRIWSYKYRLSNVPIARGQRKVDSLWTLRTPKLSSSELESSLLSSFSSSLLGDGGRVLYDAADRRWWGLQRGRPGALRQECAVRRARPLLRRRLHRGSAEQRWATHFTPLGFMSLTLPCLFSP